MVAQRPARRVGRYEGCCRDLGNVVDSGGRQVADVDHHAEPLHLGHGFYPERRKAAASAGLGDPVGQHRAPVPGKRRHAHPETVQGLEHRDRRADRLGPFDGEQQGDAAAADDPVDVDGCLGDGHIGPVEVCDLTGEGDDLQGSAQGRLADELLLGEDGKHLEHHAASTKPRQPVVAERVGHTPLAPVHAAQQ